MGLTLSGQIFIDEGAPLGVTHDLVQVCLIHLCRRGRSLRHSRLLIEQGVVSLTPCVYNWDGMMEAAERFARMDAIV